jgi:hypothetical protein
VGKSEGKRALGRPRRRWEDNIKMDFQEVGGGSRDFLKFFCGHRRLYKNGFKPCLCLFVESSVDTEDFTKNGFKRFVGFFYDHLWTRVSKKNDFKPFLGLL